MNARYVAWTCIERVESGEGYANLVTPSLVDKAELSSRDRAFAVEIVYGTLRMKKLYDAVIDRCSSRPVEDIEPQVLWALWMAAHQWIHLELPPHAVVQENVELVASLENGERARGFTNAVLRRLVERSPDEWIEIVAPGKDFWNLSVRYSYPEWVVHELHHALAERGLGKELVGLLDAQNQAPKVTLAARPSLLDQTELVSSDGRLSPTPYSPWGAVLDSGSPETIPAIRQGSAAVQDEGSQLVAGALAAAQPLQDGETWLDMCSGPGGKTGLLASLLPTNGRLDAWELHPHRAQLVRQAVRAFPEGLVQVSVGDALTLGDAESYDRIVLDAPCTGIGALRRRPDARWNRAPEDVDELATLQTALLRHALTLLKPGGVLAYITCSPLVQETRAVVTSVLNDPPVQVEQLNAYEAMNSFAQTSLSSSDGALDVQLWPHRDNTDAMYLALLKRAV